MKDTQEKYNLDVDISNVYRTVQKYMENHENPNECIEKPQILEYSNDGKISNISAVSNNCKDVQRQNVAQSNIEGGGELLSNHDKNIQAEAIEMEFEGLNIKNEFNTDKVQIIDDRNKLSNDQIKTIKAEMKKIQNEMGTMHDGKITQELENATCFKAIVDKIVDIHSHIDQFIEVVNGLKLKLEDASENKETIAEIMEVSEYLRSYYVMQVTEDQRNFTDQIKKYANEIHQLKAYADIKIKEVDTLEERANDQKLSIDSYEKAIKCITDKFSNFYSDIKQLQNENDQLSAPNEKQKEFFSLLVEQLEGMDELLKTTRKERYNMIDYLNNTFEEEHIQNT